MGFIDRPFSKADIFLLIPIDISGTIVPCCPLRDSIRCAKSILSKPRRAEHCRSLVRTADASIWLCVLNPSAARSRCFTSFVSSARRTNFKTKAILLKIPSASRRCFSSTSEQPWPPWGRYGTAKSKRSGPNEEVQCSARTTEEGSIWQRRSRLKEGSGEHGHEVPWARHI